MPLGAITGHGGLVHTRCSTAATGRTLFITVGQGGERCGGDRDRLGTGSKGGGLEGKEIAGKREGVGGVQR